MSGTLLINDDVDISIDDADYILFGASISFQKENLIYSSEFYSAHEYGFLILDLINIFSKLAF